MKIIRHTDPTFAKELRTLTSASSLFDPVIEERTRTIIDAVRTRGDEALLEFTARFDSCACRAEQLAVTKAELMAASLHADDALRDAICLARKNVESFARRSLEKNWSARNG